MYRDILGFSIAPFMQRVMTINGFFASIMRTGKKSEQSDGSLPPGVPIPVLSVDYLKVKPESWIGGEGSYVCPIDSEWGLWFNWTMNNPDNTAILPSVKGMNPLTGQRVEGYDLGEYSEECPIHRKPFSKGKLCTECGFKWPAQNYISKPNKFFLDGFRTPDGNVRQFYFTEDMAKSVPELVIGKEDTVPAFGFCFYKLKDFKPKWEEGERLKNKFPEFQAANRSFLATDGIYPFKVSEDTCGSGYSGVSGYSGYSGSEGKKYVDPGIFVGSIIRERRLAKSSDVLYRSVSSGPVSEVFNSSDMPKSSCCFSAPAASMDVAECSVSTDGGNAFYESSGECMSSHKLTMDSFEAPLRKSAEVGIGAGAKIKQGFEKSKNSVEDWEKKPAGVIRIYFVFQEEFEKYASAGFNNLEGNESGYLEGVPVGGSHE